MYSRNFQDETARHDHCMRHADFLPVFNR